MQRITDIVDLATNQTGNDQDRPGRFVINDIVLFVPPTAISIHKEGLEYNYKSLRTKVSTKIASGNGVYHAQIKLVFPREGVLQLHRLICQIRNNPFVTIENEFINDSLNKYFYVNNVPNSFVVMGLQISNHPASPEAFICELDVRLFNPLPYTRVLGFKKDFLSQELKENKKAYYSHIVFPTRGNQFEGNKVLNYKEDIANKIAATQRSILNKRVNFSNEPVVNGLIEIRAKDSNAYKRYCNYLQIKSLTENFNIEFLFEGEGSPDSSNNDKTIIVLPQLKAYFETGIGEGNRQIYGLHEVVKKNAIDPLLINFRNQLIDKIFAESSSVFISYKEYKSIPGEKGFIERLTRSINSGTKGLGVQEAIKVREENRKQIFEFLSGRSVSAGKGSEKQPTRLDSLGRRDIKYLRATPEEANKFTYYPLLPKMEYKEEGKDYIFRSNSISKSKVIPVFAPVSGEISINGNHINGNGRYIIYEGIEVLSKIKEALLTPEGDYYANKGDIIGFVKGEKSISLSVLDEDILNYYKTLSSPKETKKVVRVKRGDGKEFLFLTEADIKALEEVQKKHISQGWQFNTSRIGSTRVLEKIVSQRIDFYNKEEDVRFEKPATISGFSCSLRNIVSSIPILGLETPTYQYLGSMEPAYHFSLIGRSLESGLPEKFKYLENARNTSLHNAKAFNFIPDSHNINVDCLITKLVGSFEESSVSATIIEGIGNNNLVLPQEKPNFSISSVDTFTVEGSPGSAGMNFRFSESKSYNEEDLKAVKTSANYKDIAKETMQVLKNGSFGNEYNLNLPISKAKQNVNYAFKAWRTKYFNAKSFYAKRTSKIKVSDIDEKLDANAFHFCKEYLDPIQEAVWIVFGRGNNGYNLQFKPGGTIDSSEGRNTNSNHFAFVAADLFIEGLPVKWLAALVFYMARRGMIKPKVLRKEDQSTKVSIGMGIYGSEAYGDFATDEAVTLMGRGKAKKAGGFVHVDANYLITDTNREIPETARPKTGRGRFWVGDSGLAKFRTKDDSGVQLSKPQSANVWWGTEIYEVIDQLELSSKLNEEALDADGQANVDNEDSNETTETASKLTPKTKTTFQKDYRDISDIDDLKSIFGELGINDDITVKTVSYADLTEHQKNKLLPKNAADNPERYSYIVIEENEIFENKLLKNEKQYNDLRKYLQENHALTIKEYKPGIQGTYDFLSEIVLPITKKYSVQRKNKDIAKALKTNLALITKFRGLANSILTEPYLYLDSEEEIQKELKFINGQLYDIGVMPHLFGNINALAFGVEDEQASVNRMINRMINKAISASMNNSAALSGIGTGLGTLGVQHLYKKSAAKIGGRMVFGSSTGVGAIPSLLIGAAWFFYELYDISTFITGLENNVKRIKAHIKESKDSYKMKRAVYYNAFNTLRLQAVLSNKEETKKLLEEVSSFQNNPDREDEFVQTFKKFGNAYEVDEGINNLVGIIYGKNPILKEFSDLSSELNIVSNTRNILNFSEKALKNLDQTELAESQKSVGASLVAFELIDYLRVILRFPYNYDRIANETEFNEIFNVDRNDPNKLTLVEPDDEDELFYQAEEKFAGQEYAVNYQYNNNNNNNKGNAINKFFETRKEQLRQNQVKKVAWLKVLLDSILRDIAVNSKEEAIRRNVSAQLTEIELFDGDAYPDIDRPLDPRDLLYGSKLSPTFYYWDSKNFKKDLKDALVFNKQVRGRAKDIINSSLKFQEDLEKGVLGSSKLEGENTFLLREITDGLPTDAAFKDLKDSTSLQNQVDAINKSVKKEVVSNNFVEGNKDRSGILKKDLASSMDNLGNSYDNFFEANDMLKAFPTFKLYLIEEDEIHSDKLLVFDDFYSYNSVVSFNFHNSRELAASTATIQLQNISGTLDGSKKAEVRDIDLNPNVFESGTDTMQDIVDSIVLRPGVNIQLRAGYSENAKDLTVLLSGRITDVNYSADNTLCNIIVQSFGYELETQIKGAFAKGKNETYRTTSEILASIVLSEELKHFGRVKEGRIFTYEEGGDQLWIDIKSTKQNSDYFYSLLKSNLSFFEENAGKVAFAVGVGTAVAFLGRGLAAKPLNKLFQSKLGLGFLNYSGRFIEKLPFKTTRGVIGKGLGGISNITRMVVGGQTRLTREVIGNARFATTLRGSLLTPGAITSGAETVVKTALENAFRTGTLSRYQFARLMGKGRIGSFIFKLRKSVSADTVFNRVDMQAFSNHLTIKALGYEQASNLISGLGLIQGGFTGARLSGGIGGFINYGNIFGKAAGYTTFSLAAALLFSAIGAGLGAVWSALTGYEESLQPLRKKLLLSPADDNLYPPDPKHYYDGSKSRRGYTDLITDKTLSIFQKASSLFSVTDVSQASSFIDLINNVNAYQKKKILGDEIEYVINNQTSWEVLKDLTLRHPGYVYGSRPYGEGLEYRMFFGLPNEKHFVKPLSNFQARRSNMLNDYVANTEANKNLLDILYSREKKLLKKLGEKDRTLFLDNLAKEEYTSRIEERFVPFRKYHYVDSSRNLISNDIVCSSHNVINTVKVHFSYDGEGKKTSSNDGEATQESIYTMTLKASRSIPPELERPKIVSGPNINGIGCANRYGLGSLIYGVKEMYTGSLLILGDPKINPWDVIILDDKITNMYGPLEVKSVTHMFGHDTGFLTNVEVNAFVTGNDPSAMAMIEQSIVFESVKKIFDKHSSRTSFNLTGDKIADKARLKEVVEDIIKAKITDYGRGEYQLGGITHLGASTVATTGVEALQSMKSVDENVLESLTNKLYDVYTNNDKMFYNDIFDDTTLNLPDPIKGDIAAALGVGGLGVAGSGGVAITGTKLIERATGATMRGGYRGGLIGIGVGAGLFLLSKTETARDAIDGVANHYFSKYLKENIVRPQILGTVTGESLIKIVPLVKDGRPLLAGGIEQVSEKEKWNRILTNLYNNISDATAGYLAQRDNLSAQGEDIITRGDNGDYSWVKRQVIDVSSLVGQVVGLESKEAVGYVYGDTTGSGD